MPQSNESDSGVIILVDDEEMVVDSIATFLRLETSYEVMAFTSPKKALDYLRTHDVDLVISDFLMPEMDGIHFLAGARELRPEVPRIMLTGYADKENAIKAINDVGLYQYLEKPWDNEDLRLLIRNGVERRRLMAKLEAKIGEINRAHSELQSLQKEILKAFA